MIRWRHQKKKNHLEWNLFFPQSPNCFELEEDDRNQRLRDESFQLINLRWRKSFRKWSTIYRSIVRYWSFPIFVADQRIVKSTIEWLRWRGNELLRRFLTTLRLERRRQFSHGYQTISANIELGTLKRTTIVIGVVEERELCWSSYSWS